MFGELGCYNVVMMSPERSEYRLTYFGSAQKNNLAQLYCAEKQGLVPNAWTLGILFNVHKFPFLDQDGNEQSQVDPWH